MTASVLDRPEVAARPTAQQRGMAPSLRLWLAGVIAAVCLLGFLTWNIRGNIEFALALRGATAGAMVIAALAPRRGYRHLPHRHRELILAPR